MVPLSTQYSHAHVLHDINSSRRCSESLYPSTRWSRKTVGLDDTICHAPVAVFNSEFHCHGDFHLPTFSVKLMHCAVWSPGVRSCSRNPLTWLLNVLGVLEQVGKRGAAKRRATLYYLFETASRSSAAGRRYDWCTDGSRESGSRPCLTRCECRISRDVVVRYERTTAMCAPRAFGGTRRGGIDAHRPRVIIVLGIGTIGPARTTAVGPASASVAYGRPLFTNPYNHCDYQLFIYFSLHYASVLRCASSDSAKSCKLECIQQSRRVISHEHLRLGRMPPTYLPSSEART